MRNAVIGMPSVARPQVALTGACEWLRVRGWHIDRALLVGSGERILAFLLSGSSGFMFDKHVVANSCFRQRLIACS